MLLPQCIQSRFKVDATGNVQSEPYVTATCANPNSVLLPHVQSEPCVTATSVYNPEPKTLLYSAPHVQSKHCVTATCTLRTVFYCHISVHSQPNVNATCTIRTLCYCHMNNPNHCEMLLYCDMPHNPNFVSLPHVQSEPR